MILVTVGTHELPFDRLVRAARRLPGERVVQRGTSSLEVPGARVERWFEPSVLRRLMAEADVVVCHGGPATIREALAAGKIPVVVPRKRRYGEHVDDHQVAFARRMVHRVHLVEDPADLPEAVRRHAEVCRGLEPPQVEDRGEVVGRAIEALARTLVRGPA